MEEAERLLVSANHMDKISYSGISVLRGTSSSYQTYNCSAICRATSMYEQFKVRSPKIQ